ncbi:anthranilate synthase component 1 [Tepidamorphus gemmatus]|uniref:Anthranilate synthase component 1 n=1 Tax=Tepidamorphus gemmatus TaxID=747076 RepID=A0A4V2UZU4_9HYPH|nr:anthranilate synthase component I [Tepidamorphus gemmatus]TCT12573.1 anthranilate synthase component 1 [Tepidamorphus gemmatus]
MSTVEPGYDAFEERYRLGAAQVVWTRLVADLETPVSAMLKIAGERPNSILLESVEGGAVRGRYSIIGLAPDLVFRARGNHAEINRCPELDPDAFEPCAEPTLAALRRLINEARVDLPEGLPPMSAGVFGYMGYDTVRLMEHLPAEKPDPLGLPDAIFVRPTLMVVFDSVKDEVTVVTPVRPSAAVSAKAAYENARARIEEVTAGLDRPISKAPMAEADDIISRAPVSNTSPNEYKDMVLRAKDYIAAGDIFQVVLSQRFEAPFTLPPFALYRALRRTNPAPFLFFLNFRDFAVVGSSPEILVRLRERTVTIRPIAGTRPRGATPSEDKAMAEELLADPKERAEHLMLLDLGRNDVGRVSRIGTVRVTDQFFLEFYSQVMHIVSNVEGEIDPARDAIDALIAGFPAGTVSGAPKVRAMQIIDELEKDKRGIYAGCVGYFSADGDMDTCIVLRTAVVKDGRMYVQAGAGIVADSDPDSEQRECINKARALFRAADEAVRFASAAARGQ